jgi:hypothetical protein
MCGWLVEVIKHLLKEAAVPTQESLAHRAGRSALALIARI